MDKPITLITGTRKGIGKYLSEYYVEKGHIVIGCSRSSIDWSLPNYKHFELDVSDEKSVRNLFRCVRKEYGRVDNVINNAGIASMNHALITPLSTVNEVLKTNFIGTFLFCREAGKMMTKNKYGRIVNFTTVATPLKLEGEAVYAASKAAILSLTQVLARELAPFNITVNAIGPTPIETDLIRSVPNEKMQALVQRQAINRYGEFQDVSNVIDFYINKKSDFITGQNIYLGGVS
ncbi:MAG: oxidoreductase [Gammaproteobacteria bacterium RIFCSPHIGHO2_12_FULL_45_12]|nr:MAG: oxidoreductase [Gammaproteobacteria bacterium RIFCSPHIGHO2_12_FULL_45_12]